MDKQETALQQTPRSNNMWYPKSLEVAQISVLPFKTAEWSPIKDKVLHCQVFTHSRNEDGIKFIRSCPLFGSQEKELQALTGKANGWDRGQALDLSGWAGTLLHCCWGGHLHLHLDSGTRMERKEFLQKEFQRFEGSADAAVADLQPCTRPQRNKEQ